MSVLEIVGAAVFVLAAIVAILWASGIVRWNVKVDVNWEDRP